MSTDYDYDGIDNGLPDTEVARQRLITFVSDWGDGEIMEGLHTRDIAALIGRVS